MEQELYTINHVSLITGLTTRTLRSYITMGLLQGEKINGLWHFGQVDAFIRHPKVLPSIQAKHNAIVYDFLMDSKKTVPEACMVLDLPGKDQKATADFFCNQITNAGYHSIRFSFSTLKGAPRVILNGHPEDILSLSGNIIGRPKNNSIPAPVWSGDTSYYSK